MNFAGSVDRGNKCEWLRATCRITSNTVEDSRKGDSLAPPTQLLQTSRVGDTTTATAHPEHSLASKMQPKYTERPVTPDAHQGEFLCTDAIAKLSVALKLLNITAILAMDKLGMVARMVEHISPHGIQRSPDRQHSRSADAPDGRVKTLGSFVNVVQPLIQHSLATVVSGTLGWLRMCTLSARDAQRPAFEESSHQKFHCTVMVIRARARLSLLVRWLRAVFREYTGVKK